MVAKPTSVIIPSSGPALQACLRAANASGLALARSKVPGSRMRRVHR